ncbi:MAG: hypothetical protein A3K19_27095 [Lentisphaerae bacterium RIFOXYB12_FULL_65_16]|nr:MAG: hypothetical protein A3K18_24470 [Lentisphaerae bacterium RIFOXYA12_64_32]OGV90255.1 MAG: hypothetical protein A3K19_27095 [Lentisphaerae bacterium RIFOXYB12_FULL_65_16]
MHATKPLLFGICPVGPSTRSRSHSFTLIELLVVIAIIGILASLLLPALEEARKKGKSATCLGHVKQLDIACKLYLEDNDGRYPNGGYAPTGGCWPSCSKGCGFPSTHWQSGAMQRLRDYAGSTEIFYCPAKNVNPAVEAARVVPVHLPEVDAGMTGYSGYGFFFSRANCRDLWKTPSKFSPMEPLILDHFELKDIGSFAYVNCGTLTPGVFPPMPHRSINIGHNDGHAATYTPRDGLWMRNKRVWKDQIY